MRWGKKKKNEQRVKDAGRAAKRSEILDAQHIPLYFAQRNGAYPPHSAHPLEGGGEGRRWGTKGQCPLDAQPLGASGMGEKGTNISCEHNIDSKNRSEQV